MPGSSPPPSPALLNDGKRARRLAAIRAQWGKPVERDRDLPEIGLLHAAKPRTEAVVGDREWEDLGMDEVFAVVDRTVSMPGRQVLYDQLRTYVRDDAVLAERARQQGVFRQDDGLRERIQCELDRLNGRGAAYIGSLVYDAMPAKPAFAWALVLLSILTPACLIGMFVVHPLISLALALVLVNAVIFYTYGQRIAPHYLGFSQLNTMLAVAKRLATIDDGDARLPQLAKLRSASSLISTLQNRLGWLVADRNALPELVAALLAYLNMICLLDIVVFLRSIHVLAKNQRQLQRVFDAVGSLDAALAVASYTAEVPGFTTPTLVDGRVIAAEGLYHPLIPGAVANDLSLEDRSALISGPNMAGKTAFIRTVGINLLFAQTIHVCLARRATFPRAVVKSSIRREDRLTEGESYFFTEIKQLLDFTNSAPTGERQIYLIDEIYRGTNTVERIAASAAVLGFLARHQTVLATTHDVELHALLDAEFAMYHFGDQVIDGRYGFDYRLYPGPVRSRNAIRLLELTGYPPEIIRVAERLVADAERRQSALPPAAISDAERTSLPEVPLSPKA